jgi:imidazole glycerol-phosphate synthase subunit HisF
MLAFRVIARLDIKSPNLVKTVRLDGVKPIGDPAVFARKYNEQGIDELVYLDIVASLYQRNSLGPLLSDVTDDVFIPVTAAGGVRNIDDVRGLLASGADKVALNTAALVRPQLIDELARKFGSSTIVVQIDAKQRGPNKWEAFSEGGRQASGADAVDWAKEVAQRGCGEIFLTSVDREGTGQGLDCRLIEEITGRVSVPVVVSGGTDSPPTVWEGWRCGASGVAISGSFHFDRFTVDDVKSYLASEGVPIRR